MADTAQRAAGAMLMLCTATGMAVGLRCTACLMDGMLGGMGRMFGVVGTVGQFQEQRRMVVQLRGCRRCLERWYHHRCGSHGHGVAQQAPKDQQQDQGKG